MGKIKTRNVFSKTGLCYSPIKNNQNIKLVY